MTIFLLPTTATKPVPSAAESKALSAAHRQISEGKINEARQTLFAVFSPAVAEKHFEEINQRFAPPAPVITAPRPAMQTSPLILLVKIGIVAALACMVFNALTSR